MRDQDRLRRRTTSRIDRRVKRDKSTEASKSLQEDDEGKS